MAKGSSVSEASAWAIAPGSLAFVGAEGFGRHARGGRGGVVYEVTTLEDSEKPGTLRHALLQPHPRIIRFRVSGIIMLQSPLLVENGNVTLEGQSSPRGIVVAGAPVTLHADEVIIRYLRFRLGTFGYEDDSLSAVGCKQVMIDHCSMSWSIDETASFYNNQDFTLQYCLITNSLRDSIHTKGKHGYGGIWGGKRASFIRNVLANHDSRVPRVNGHRIEPGYPVEQELVEVVNCFIYNWGRGNVYGAEDGRLDLIGNYYLPGPDSRHEGLLELYPSQQGFSEIYLAENYYAGKPEWFNRNRGGVGSKKEGAGLVPTEQRLVSSRRVAERRNILSPEQLPGHLIENRRAGANLVGDGPFLDSVDAAVYEQIAKRLRGEPTGSRFLNHETEQIDSWEVYGREFGPKEE